MAICSSTPRRRICRPPSGARPGRCRAAFAADPRELEVMALVAHGLSNRQISQKLVLSEATVKTHVARVIMKTGCRDRAQAVAVGYRSGLVRVS